VHFGFFSFKRNVPTAYLLKAVQIVQAVQPLRSVQAVHERNGGAVAASTRMIL
jgi:hypothetical protein